MRSLLVGLVLVLLSAPAALAADHGGIAVMQAWTRASPGQAPNGAVYFVIRNAGPSADVLTGAYCEVAQKTELHESMMSGAMMQMKPLAEVPIPAGQAVEFKPGGRHVMLMGLKAPLKEGDHFPLTLDFKSAGAQTVEVAVVGVAGEGPAAMPMH
jgi:periplasmic copper chaperone A